MGSLGARGLFWLGLGFNLRCSLSEGLFVNYRVGDKDAIKTLNPKNTKTEIGSGKDAVKTPNPKP